MFDQLKACHCHKHIIAGLAAVFLLILSVFFVIKIRNGVREYGYIGRAPLAQYTVTVNGEGKVTAVPDIAVINLGVRSEAKTVKAAQEDNSKKMNAIVDATKQLGVADADIQTKDYNIYPNYSYNKDTGISAIVGYTVSQSVAVKVRDLDKVGSILYKAGELGANQVGGVQFTVDNPDSLQAKAREKAIDNAKIKANILFDKLGVKPGRIVSFSEYSPSEGLVYMKEGIGGGGAPAPSIETGSLDITVDVSLTFEIK